MISMKVCKNLIDQIKCADVGADFICEKKTHVTTAITESTEPLLRNTISEQLHVY